MEFFSLLNAAAESRFSWVWRFLTQSWLLPVTPFLFSFNDAHSWVGVCPKSACINSFQWLDTYLRHTWCPFSCSFHCASEWDENITLATSAVFVCTPPIYSRKVPHCQNHRTGLSWAQIKSFCVSCVEGKSSQCILCGNVRCLTNSIQSSRFSTQCHRGVKLRLCCSVATWWRRGIVLILYFLACHVANHLIRNVSGYSFLVHFWMSVL